MTGTLTYRDGTCGLGERRDMGGETPPFRGVSPCVPSTSPCPVAGVPMSRVGLAGSETQGALK